MDQQELDRLQNSTAEKHDTYSWFTDRRHYIGHHTHFDNLLVVECHCMIIQHTSLQWLKRPHSNIAVAPHSNREIFTNPLHCCARLTSNRQTVTIIL